MNFNEYHTTYTKLGFKALRCKGYIAKYNTKQDRSIAKQAVDSNFTKAAFKGLSLDECLTWLDSKGWLGWVIPKAYIVLDVDKNKIFVDQIVSYIKEKNLKCFIANTSNNNKHFIFKKSATKIKGATDERIILGQIGITFRNGGSNYLIMPPQEKRSWLENFEVNEKIVIDQLPRVFENLNLKKVNNSELISSFIWQIAYYIENTDYLSINDDLLIIIHFLKSELGLANSQIQEYMEIIFKGKYKADRVDYHLIRLEEGVESPRTINSLLGKIKSTLWAPLEHVYLLIRDIKAKNQYLSSEDGKNEKRLQEFNSRYGLYNLKTSVVVIDKKLTLERGVLIYYTKPGLKMWLADDKPIFIVSAGKSRPIHIVDYWLNAKEPVKNKYDKIVTEPHTENIQANELNLWRGWKVQPKEGLDECGLYLNLIFEVIANRDEDLYEYILNWMADAIQKPTNRQGIALAIHGKQGIGKGMFARIFGYLYGQHFKHLTSIGSVTGQFNSSLQDKLLVFVDEMNYNLQRKKDVGKIKSYITEPTIDIEAKGKDIYTLANNIRFIFAGNAENIVPIESSDRRFCVMEANDSFKDIREYFKDLKAQMKNGGYEALLYLLQTRDISQVNLHKIPKTLSREDHIERSFNKFVRFVYRVLELGTLEDILLHFLPVKKKIDIDEYAQRSGYTTSNSIYSKSLPINFLYEVFQLQDRGNKSIGIKTFSKRFRDILKLTTKKHHYETLEGTKASIIFVSEKECKKAFNEYVGFESFEKLEELKEVSQEALPFEGAF